MATRLRNTKERQRRMGIHQSKRIEIAQFSIDDSRRVSRRKPRNYRSHSWLATRIPRPFINPAENSRWDESLKPIVCPAEFVDHESRLLPLKRLHAQIDDVNPSRLILSHASYHWPIPSSVTFFDFNNITVLFC